MLVGPDGVGKTSVARQLLEDFDGCTQYVHFWPPVRRPLPALPPASDKPTGKPELPRGSWVVGWVRLARALFKFWLGYLARVRPAVRRGCLVVADRWAYGYYAQPRPLGYLGPRWLAALAVRVMPAPDLVANLAADPLTIRERKAELTLQQIRTELKDWAELPISCLSEIDAMKDLDAVVRDIEELIAKTGSKHSF